MFGVTMYGETTYAGNPVVIPVGLGLITITGTITNPDGTPAIGQLLARLSDTIINGTDIAEAVTIRATLDPAGRILSQTGGPFKLTPNDAPNTLPAGTHYTIVFEPEDEPAQKPFRVVVPYDVEGGMIDLATLQGAGIPVP